MPRWWSLVTVAAATTAVVAAPAGATFPGRDGRLLVTVYTDQFPPGAGDPAVVSIRSDGSHARLLGRGGSAAWSPDGRRIVVSGSGGIWVARADGTHRRAFDPPRVSRYGGPFMPRWSPDGRWLYYMRAGPGEEPRTAIYRAAVDGSHQRRIIAIAKNRGGPFVLAPDGRTLFRFRTRPPGTELWAMAATGGHTRRLAVLPTSIRPEWVDISPDGSRLLLDGRHAIGTDGSGLAPFSPIAPRGVWSPSGAFVAFLRYAPPSTSELVIARADGSAEQVVMPGSVQSVDWQPRT